MNAGEPSDASLHLSGEGVSVSRKGEAHRSKHNASQKGNGLVTYPFCGDGDNDCPSRSRGSAHHGVFGRRSKLTAGKMIGTHRPGFGPPDGRNRRPKRRRVQRMDEITDGGGR